MSDNDLIKLLTDTKLNRQRSCRTIMVIAYCLKHFKKPSLLAEREIAEGSRNRTIGHFRHVCQHPDQAIGAHFEQLKPGKSNGFDSLYTNYDSITHHNVLIVHAQYVRIYP